MTFVITIPCVLCPVEWCLMTSLWIYLQISFKIPLNQNGRTIFSRTKDGVIQLYKRSMQDFTWKTKINDTNRTLRSHHYISIDSWRKYLNGITVIESTQADLDKMSDFMICAVLNTVLWLMNSSTILSRSAWFTTHSDHTTLFRSRVFTILS